MPTVGAGPSPAPKRGLVQVAPRSTAPRTGRRPSAAPVRTAAGDGHAGAGASAAGQTAGRAGPLGRAEKRGRAGKQAAAGRGARPAGAGEQPGKARKSFASPGKRDSGSKQGLGSRLAAPADRALNNAAARTGKNGRPTVAARAAQAAKAAKLAAQASANPAVLAKEAIKHPKTAMKVAAAGAVSQLLQVLFMPMMVIGLVGIVLAGTLMGADDTKQVTNEAVAGASLDLAAAIDVPYEYLVLYVNSAHACPGLRWQVVAGVGWVETNHGRSTLPGVSSGENSAGAAGPMQFLKPAWSTYGTDNPDDRYDPAIAIPATVRMLCALKAVDDEHRAASDYNVGHNATPDMRKQGDAYADKVLAKADEYAAAAEQFGAVASGDLSNVSGDAEGAVQVARLVQTWSTGYDNGAARFSNRILNASWPETSIQWFDCSSFSWAVYQGAGFFFHENADGVAWAPQTASMIRWGWKARVPPAEAQPGDWVFTRVARTDGSDEHAPLDYTLSLAEVTKLVALDGHVGVYLGGGQFADSNVKSYGTRGPDGSGVAITSYDPSKAVVVIRPLAVDGGTIFDSMHRPDLATS